jgi:hypothetical protein
MFRERSSSVLVSDMVPQGNMCRRSFRTKCARSCVSELIRLSAGCPLQRRTAQQKTVRRMAMIAIECVVVLQGIYERVKKHAYTERGQKCTRAYIKRVHNVGN